MYLRPQQAADLISAHVTTINLWIRRFRETGGSDGLRYFKTGHNTVFISKADLLDYLEAKGKVV
jgi:transposase